MLIKKIGLVIVLFVLTGCCYKKTIAVLEPKDLAADESALLVEFEKNIGSKVYFAFDSATLSKKEKVHLQKQAEWLTTHPDVRAIIEGHCDERGSEDYNLALGSRRAMAVKKFLIAHGINEKRLGIVSYGKTRPEVKDHNIEAWKLNRRTVTIVTVL